MSRRRSGSGKVGDAAARIKGSPFFKAASRTDAAPWSARPSQAFLAALPRSFKRTPCRPAWLSSKSATSCPSAPARGYLCRGAGLGQQRVPRYAGRWSATGSPSSADPAFRSAIAAGLKDHPEWDRSDQSREVRASAADQQEWPAAGFWDQMTPAGAGKGNMAMKLVVRVPTSSSSAYSWPA